MRTRHDLNLQGLVFGLVAAAFTNIYITQPVLPVLALEFGLDEAQASLSVAMVILGIALATLPFGRLVDRYPLRPLILMAGGGVSLAGVVCGVTDHYSAMVAARFVQGLFLPALTTCVAAYLANSLPAERLNVVMGAYISATVVGGLGGRLLGGFLHPPAHWRYAFFSAALLVFIAACLAAWRLPGVNKTPPHHEEALSYRQLLATWSVVRLYLAAFGAFWVFSAVFNFLPFRLGSAPFNASTGVITLVYISYLAGAVMGPLAGRMANRIGSGSTMVAGTLLQGAALGVMLIPSWIAVMMGLVIGCAGFFTTHAAATGALNRRLVASRGRGNALYVLFYYAGGTAGITASGYAYRAGGWLAVVAASGLVLLIPFLVGAIERQVQVMASNRSNPLL